MFEHDFAGIPFALGVMGYTGVLLSCTANPMWCKNPWIGPLFACSAFSTGAAAIQLIMDLRGDDAAASHVLNTVDTVGHIGEAITLVGYLSHAGANARPLTHGSMKKHMQFAVGAMVVSELLKHLPVRG